MLNIAHRGASGYAPENTVAAFDLAIAMQADMIETDIQVTRDGEPVLIHDERVDRTTNGAGPVADFTLAELQALDAGSWLGTEHAGQRIPTLEAFCDVYLPRIPACLEIKEPLATDATIAFLKSRPDLHPRIQVTSFSWIAATRAAAFDVPCGFLTKVFDEDIVHRCVRNGLVQICPHARDLTAELVSFAQGHGLFVRAWGIRDRDDVDRLFATGADGATCNWPDWIIDRGAAS